LCNRPNRPQGGRRNTKQNVSIEKHLGPFGNVVGSDELSVENQIDPLRGSLWVRRNLLRDREPPRSAFRLDVAGSDVTSIEKHRSLWDRRWVRRKETNRSRTASVPSGSLRVRRNHRILSPRERTRASWAYRLSGVPGAKRSKKTPAFAAFRVVRVADLQPTPAIANGLPNTRTSARPLPVAAARSINVQNPSTASTSSGTLLKVI